MALVQTSSFGDRLPTPIEQDDANRLKRIMDSTRGKGGGYRFLFQNEKTSKPQEVHIDAALGDTLRSVLDIIAMGQSVQIVPIEAELTTKQAAAILNVSRPFLIKLLEQQKIEFHTVGRHRRVIAADLFRYKQQQADERKKALSALIVEDDTDELL